MTDPRQVSDLRRFWFEYLLIGVLVLCIVVLVVAMFGLAGVFGRYVG